MVSTTECAAGDPPDKTGANRPAQVRLDVFFVPDDQTAVADLVAALAANGVDVHTTSGAPVDGCPLAVFITNRTLEPSVSQQVLSVANNYEEILPVSFLPGAAPLFAELSQIIVAQFGVPETATRLAAIARFSGRAIVEWNTLVGRAFRWRDEGQHALLPDRDIGPALAAIQTGPALVSSHRELAIEYVAASRAALNRRRRIRGALVTASASALSVVLAFALVQGLTAKRAQDRSHRQSDIATADRLAHNAIDLIRGDPDLPLLLVNEALVRADTPAVQDAQRQIDVATWPHRSIKLGFIPLNVSAALTTPRIAVTNPEGQEVIVYDDAGTHEVGRFRYNDVGGSVGGLGRLSPDGELLATESEYPGSLKIFAVKTGESVPTDWLRKDDKVLTWLDDRRLLVGRAEQLLTIDTHSSEATAMGVLADSDSARNAEISPDGKLVVVTGKNSHTVLSAPDRRVLRSEQAPEANHAVIEDDGTVSEPSNGQLAVFPSIGDFQFATHSDGTISLGAGGTGKTVRAHLGDRVRAERLADGRMATIGSDGYLRIWTLPNSDQLGTATDYGFTQESNRMPSSIGVHVAPRESARNQVRLAGDGSIAVTLMPGAARVVSAQDLTTVPRWFFVGLDTDVFLSRDGSRIASTGKKTARTFHFSEPDKFWNDNDKQTMDGPHMETAIASGGRGIASVSDDGKSIVYADEYGIQRLDADPSRVANYSFEQERRPVALWAGSADHPGCALTIDGFIRCTDGSEQSISWPATFSDSQKHIAAGEFVGFDTYTAVTDDGKILQKAAGGVQQIGDVGAGYDPFAVRSDTSGRALAVVGERGFAVYDLDKSAVTYREPAMGALMVTDVAFANDRRSVYSITTLGTVKHADIANGVPEQFREVPPRNLTDQERAVFALDES